jgi:hypothetical protein
MSSILRVPDCGTRAIRLAGLNPSPSKLFAGYLLKGSMETGAKIHLIKVEDSFINPKNRLHRALNGMDISDLEKGESRGKKIVKTKVRLMIREGSMEDELEIPLFRPEMVKEKRRKWFTERE